MRLVAEVVGQLDLHRPLHQPLGQLRQQATGTGDLLLTPRAGQQLIEHLIRNPLAVRALHHATQCGAVHGVPHHRIAHPTAPLAGTRRGRRRLAWRLATGAIPCRTSRSNLIYISG
jgi:hypothetical protein